MSAEKNQPVPSADGAAALEKELAVNGNDRIGNVTPDNTLREKEVALGNGSSSGGGSGGDKKTDPLSHLPEYERTIIERQLAVPDVAINYFTLFRYADKTDIIVILISTFCSITGGALLPLFTIVFGQLAGTFQGFFLGTVSGSEFNSELSKFTLYFVYLAIGQFAALYIGTVGFIYTGEAVARKTRENYLKAILRQNIGFFDKLGAGEVTTRITGDTNLIQDGISQKVALTLQSFSTFVTAFVIGFIQYWKLTLILSSTIVAITLDFGVGFYFVEKWMRKALDIYAGGGTVAEETFSSIRNAVAFGTQDKLAIQYEQYLGAAEREGFKSKIALGFSIGGMFMFTYLNYGLAFWMGSRFLVSGETNLSEIITVLLAVVFGAFGLGSIGPNFQAFSSAVAAARKIYTTIDRVSPLDPYSEDGDKPETVVGNITLRDIKLIYPSRPEVIVLEDELNIRWLRQHMSLVSQEPVLFAVSIFENIRHGLIGTPLEKASEAEIKERVENAAKMANAHEFIQALPEGYTTNVGDRGFLLSGGQKQRIAIARAIISDPKILLLDEATSALDTKSEGVVQAALDRASQGRTTVVIAHRLSTIRDSDNIVVMARGRVVEQGTHDELLNNNSTYAALVQAQQIADAVENKGEASTDASEDPVAELQREHIKEKELATHLTRTTQTLRRR
ncbi:hypothetical protein H2199_002230 [Coniosporium tulheliwenetii]|uniref:Uncharacterized protein n=1 Tax=Coniosporium tulheliwenetii TaxID=3383036 RepID=A0ACC2ZI76_9PEZI|nr:hypothetical protein H2199_002230 [Cladosporium sp. JES 115]